MTGCNVEIKARATNPDHVVSIAEKIADSGPMNIEQEDVYFNCSKGRLKLRKFSDKTGELIYYNRDSGPEPTECNYSILKTSDPTLIDRILTEALGVRGTIRKRRTLYLCGPTRIHFDDVDGLGKFIEIEVVLSPGQAASQGMDIARSLMQRLGIAENDLVDAAYIDMLIKQTD